MGLMNFNPSFGKAEKIRRMRPAIKSEMAAEWSGCRMEQISRVQK